MNRESIETRLLELQKQLEQVQANGNALLGAIQDCNYWLEVLKRKSTVKIKLLQDTQLEDGQHKAGESLDVINEIAKQLIATGAAELDGVVSQPIPEQVIEKLEDLPVIKPGRKARKSNVG